MSDKLSRRELLKGGVTALVGSVLGRCALASLERPTRAGDPTLTPRAHLPLVRNNALETPTSTPTPTATPTGAPRTPMPGVSRVVHIHDSGATNWDFGQDYYGSFVDQGVVDAMVDRGVRELTGASSASQAWQQLIPDYQPGRAIAIKANFNNSLYCEGCLTGCEDWQLKIDALVHPINSVIRGLAAAYPALDHGDIWVYDATPGRRPGAERKIPARFRDGCLYEGIRFFDRGCCESATFDSTDPSASISFSPLQGTPPPDQKVTDVLVEAAYVINMPIMKRHMFAGVTLGFKNHFGTINACQDLHDWVALPSDLYCGTAYSPLVELYSNPNIGDKTVLTIGDGLFGNWESNETKPHPWVTFGGRAPNSLLFSADPVSIDSVMCDLLYAEGYRTDERWYDYLVVAASAGLGTYERGDPWREPWGSGYDEIDYRRVEL